MIAFVSGNPANRTVKLALFMTADAQRFRQAGKENDLHSSIPRLCPILTWAVLACWTLSIPAQEAQQLPPQRPPSTQDSLSTGEQVQTLEEVRALPPEEEALDLYRFKNPIKVESNGPLGERWKEPPSPQQIAEGGGYLQQGINKAIGAVAKGLQQIPGVRHQVQPAIARPPPELTDAQQHRLLRACGGKADECKADIDVPSPHSP